MADLNNAKKDFLDWKRFYPKWGGINEAVDATDRWYFEMRRTASRVEARKTILAMHGKIEDGNDVDFAVMEVGRHVRGPFNLTDGDESLDEIGLVAFMERYDAHDLMTEFQDELSSLLELDEETVGNSDAPSGGDIASKDGAEEKDEAPATSASELPVDLPVPESSTEEMASP